MNILLKHALEYAEMGWAVFPLDGKRPYKGTHGHLDATTEPKKIRRMWKERPEANIGIACSWDNGPIVVDVDGPDGKELLKSLGRLPPTLKARSGKKGVHYYYMPDDGEPIRRSIKLQGDALDLLSEGGYVVAPPSIHPETGKAYKWLNEREPIDLPKKIRRMLGESKNRGPAPPLPDVIPEGQRDDLLTSLAGSMRRRNASPKAILAALEAMNDECEKPLLQRDLKKIAKSSENWEAGGEHNPALEELNETYAIVQLGNSTRILQDREDSKDLAFLPPADFNLLLSNRKVEVPAATEGATKLVPLTKLWLAWPERREFACVVFKPGEDEVPADEFNLWRGWTVEPSQKGSCMLFLKHLRNIVCRGNVEHYEWFLDWLADIAQRPMGLKPGVAVGIQGDQGAGKSLVGTAMKKMLGRCVVVAEKGGHVTGRFNGHLAYCLLLQAEEAFWAGDKRGEATLKHLVTGDWLLIERKGIDTIGMPNYTRVLVTSNEEWVWPTSVGDRRFVLFKAKNTYAEKGTASRKDREAYFESLFGQLEDGGYEKLLHILLTREIDDKRLRKPPRTKALEEQAIYSMSPEETWLLDLLTHGRLPHARVDEKGNAHVLTGRLYDSYASSLGRGKYKQSEKAFGIFLTQHVGKMKIRYMGESRRFWSDRRSATVQSQRRVVRPLAECRMRYSARGRAAPQKWPKRDVWKSSK